MRAHPIARRWPIRWCRNTSRGPAASRKMRDMSGAAPVLLLSMPQMTDPNFSRTVILLCDYTEEGAFGLVVNRQMSEPAWTVVKTEPPVTVDPELRLWLGGPVDPQQTWVLMADSHGHDDEQREICPGVLLSVSKALTME